MQKDELIKVLRLDLLPLEIKWSCICAGKEMCHTQYECVMRNPGCCFFARACLMWCCGGSTVDSLKVDEKSVVVVLLVVVVSGVVFVLVVSLGP